MELLHILFGSVIRAVLPKPVQDQAGKVLFWGLLLALGWLVVLAVTNSA